MLPERLTITPEPGLLLSIKTVICLAIFATSPEDSAKATCGCTRAIDTPISAAGIVYL